MTENPSFQLPGLLTMELATGGSQEDTEQPQVPHDSGVKEGMRGGI
ncbi:MAG TPA: hypothetical protein GX529_03340 [Firmicutes bacterium]|nr:hypothetical protein [Candidatus Fermentithermobacillaceae bacterium]